MYHLLLEIAIRESAREARKILADQPISDRWRGWHYDSAHFRPPYAAPLLSMGEILDLPPGGERYQNPDRIVGDLIHSLYHQVIKVSSDFISQVARRNQLFGLGNHLVSKEAEIVEAVIAANNDVSRALDEDVVHEGWLEARKADLGKIWEYETRLAGALTSYNTSALQRISLAALRAKCAPFESEMDCDGRHIQLSENLRIDARTIRYESMIVDIKTGTKETVNRVATAGYALAWESQESTPIDLGCIYYVRVPGNAPAPLIECDIFPITTTLRSTLIERRNEILVRKNEQ